MSNKVTCRDFKHYPGSVFVTPAIIPDSAVVQMKVKDWTGVATDIVKDTPLRPAPPEPKPVETREHRSILTPDTIHAVIEQMDRRWLKASEILSVATSQFQIEANLKSLEKVLHNLYTDGNLHHKQVGPQEWYQYASVNWRLRNRIVVNMRQLQRVRDWSPASRIKDEMYDKYNLLTVEIVSEALDTLAETDSRMSVETIDGKRQYHYRAESAPTPEKPQADLHKLLSEVDRVMGMGVS